MKIIFEGNTNLLKLLGKQRLKDVVYRKMNYVLQAECEEGLLLHNVITGKLVLLNSDEMYALQLLPCQHLEKMNSLIENYFLVPVEYDEKVMVYKLRILMNKIFTPKGTDVYTIFTTTNCNARCFYCYQSNYSHINMSEETASKVVDYMIKHKKEKPLHLAWFGGEPLVGIKIIDQVCNELQQKSIDFNSSMISNGYLFTEEIVDRAIERWHLRSIQITVDGTEAVYNKTKAYVAVTGSPYKRVLNNIELLLKRGIRVNTRLNLDQHNGNDLNNLVDYLLERFGEFKGFDAYVHVLYENEGFTPIARNQEARQELFKLQTALNTRIISRGYGKYHQVLPQVKTRSCMADSPNAVVVYPDGHLYKCEHVMPEDVIGNLEEGIIDFDNVAKFQKTTELNTCNKCPLLPTCYLLEECEGTKDRNSITCEFDIASRTTAITEYYQQWVINNKSRSEEVLDIAEMKC